jgi:hypothetical protein
MKPDQKLTLTTWNSAEKWDQAAADLAGLWQECEENRRWVQGDSV